MWEGNHFTFWAVKWIWILSHMWLSPRRPIRKSSPWRPLGPSLLKITNMDNQQGFVWGRKDYYYQPCLTNHDRIVCQRWALSYSPCKCVLAVGIGNLPGCALKTPLGPESRWTQSQKHRSTRGVRRQPASPRESQALGRCLLRSNPFFVAPPRAAPCWGWIGRKMHAFLFFI